MQTLYVVLALAMICASQAAPLEKKFEIDPEFGGGYFEGDIVLDRKRSGQRNATFRWPNNIVYYHIHEGSFDDEHVKHILRGMRNIEAVSCIRFKEAEINQKYYVNITGLVGGCYSSVGFLNTIQTYNLQVYPLDSGCFRIGTIMHEFLHTLGFFHMQSSSDRDEYVRIVEENIQDGTLHNFNKYDENFVDAYDEEYDYGSIMHYPAYAFSKNGKMTIVPTKNPGAADIMGQRREMSKSDINRLNTMYRCPLST